VNRLVECPLEGGGSVAVEVAESELPEGPVHAACTGEIAAKATQSFEAALAEVRLAAEGIIANLPTISVLSAEIEVAFSIKLSAGG
jgi:Trypsin-co-occurring domain 1